MITLAIVPILVQAGTSILPALFAGAGTYCLILLRPFRFLRGSRWRSAVTVCALAILSIAIGSIWAGFQMIRGRTHTEMDWAQVALNMIRSEQLANKTSSADGDGPIHLEPIWEFKMPGASF